MSEHRSSTKVEIEGPAIDSILEERGDRYGDYSYNAACSQMLKRHFRNHSGWAKMTDGQKEALDLIATKLSRILTGDPHYKDNWIDIEGYARLVSDRLR